MLRFLLILLITTLAVLGQPFVLHNPDGRAWITVADFQDNPEFYPRAFRLSVTRLFGGTLVKPRPEVEVATWVDAQGRRHYGDAQKAPADAEQLSLADRLTRLEVPSTEEDHRFLYWGLAAIPVMALVLFGLSVGFFPPREKRRPEAETYHRKYGGVSYGMLPDPAHGDYSLLGLEPGASKRQVKRAWKRKLSACHPDKNGHASEAAREDAHRQAQAVNAAYERIMAKLS